MRIPLILEALVNQINGPFVRVPSGCWKIVPGGNGLDLSSVAIFTDPVCSLGTLHTPILVEGPCDLQVRYTGEEIKRATFSVYAEMVQCH